MKCLRGIRDLKKWGRTAKEKNNDKYNNCTLECIELSTCTKLSLKLQREKTFFRVVGTTRTLQQKLSRYLFSFIEKHLIAFVFTKFKAKKANPNGAYKERTRKAIFLSRRRSPFRPRCLRSLFQVVSFAKQRKNSSYVELYINTREKRPAIRFRCASPTGLKLSNKILGCSVALWVVFFSMQCSKIFANPI